LAFEGLDGLDVWPKQSVTGAPPRWSRWINQEMQMLTKTNTNPTSLKAGRAAKITAPLMAVAPVKPGIRRRRAKAEVVATPAAPIALPLPVAPVAASKQARLICLLRGSSGATLEQMMALTGWQAHTVRGAISGVLRKRLGLNVVCDSASESGAGSRCYRILSTGA
jgi:hypothetical protein